MEGIDTSLQTFKYTLNPGLENETFTFCTFQDEQKEHEVVEIFSIFGNQRLMLEAFGAGLEISTLQEAAQARELFSCDTSLLRDSRTIRWKLYYSSRKAQREDHFIGFAGLSHNSASGLLKPHIILLPDFHNRGVGTKACICLLAKLLSLQPWLSESVLGLLLEVHPISEAGLRFINKLFRGSAVQQRNSEREDGNWIVAAKWFEVEGSGIGYRRRFVLQGVKRLEELFSSRVRLGTNTDLHLLTSSHKVDLASLKITKEPNQESDVTKVSHQLDSRIRQGRSTRIQNDFISKTDMEIEADLQDFAYTFNYGARCEKLVFRTYKKFGSQVEIDELFSLYGDENLMKYYGREMPITRDQAVLMRERLRKRTSLVGGVKIMLWKLYIDLDAYQKYSKETFFGVAIVVNNGGLLDPSILLLKSFHNKGYGPKVNMCIMNKLFSKKSWLLRFTKGLRMTINPENTQSLRMKDKLLKNCDAEIKNPAREDGIWHFERKAYCDSRMNTVRRRQFMCTDMGVVEAALSSLIVQRVNKSDMMLLLNDDYANSERVTVAGCDLNDKIGVQQVHVFLEDVQTLASELLWHQFQFPDEVGSLVVNTFDLILPDETQHEDPQLSNSFFLLMFIEDITWGFADFEVTRFDRRGTRTGKKFIAFSHFLRDEPCIRIRFNKSELGGVAAYLMELDSNVFDKRVGTTTVNLKSHLRRLWGSGKFCYNKNKRKYGFQRYESKIEFASVDIR